MSVGFAFGGRVRLGIHCAEILTTTLAATILRPSDLRYKTSAVCVLHERSAWWFGI